MIAELIARHRAVRRRWTRDPRDEIVVEVVLEVVLVEVVVVKVIVSRELEARYEV